MQLLPGPEILNTATTAWIFPFSLKHCSSFCFVFYTSPCFRLHPGFSTLTTYFPYPSLLTHNYLSPALTRTRSFNSSSKLPQFPSSTPLPLTHPLFQTFNPHFLAKFSVPPSQSSLPGSLIPVYLLSLIPSQDHRCFSRPLSISHSLR